VSANAEPVRYRRPAPRASARSTRRVSPVAIALMALAAALLLGVVTVQIAVVRQNMDRGQLEDRIGQLQSEQHDLNGRLARLQNKDRVAAWAQQHHMVAVPSNVVTPLAPGTRTHG
jgi:cell division protein FtsL